MNAIKEITEEEKADLGKGIASLLYLKKKKSNYGTPPSYETMWGTKTPLGLYETMKRIIETGKV